MWALLRQRGYSARSAIAMGGFSEQDVARYLVARPWPTRDLSRLAAEAGADPLLLRAIYLLETEFRPWWFRAS